MLTKVKLAGILLGLTIISIILHNMFYAVLGVEEPMFFILSLLFALVFAIYVGITLVVFAYNEIRRQIRKKGRVH